jgi:hypothetical protein
MTASNAQMRILQRRVNNELGRYLVDDEIGTGYGKDADGSMVRRIYDVAQINNAASGIIPSEADVLFEYHLPSTGITSSDEGHSQMHNTTKDDTLHTIASEVHWLESEIEIDATEEKATLPDGLADIELD